MIGGACHTLAETVDRLCPTLLLCHITTKPLLFFVLCPAITKLDLAPSFGAGAKAFGSGLPVCALGIPNLPQTTDEQGSRIWGGFFVPFVVAPLRRGSQGPSSPTGLGEVRTGLGSGSGPPCSALQDVDVAGFGNSSQQWQKPQSQI